MTSHRWIATLAAAYWALHGTPGWAESGAYRVEVLVLRHLESAAEPREVEALRHFGGAFPLDDPHSVPIPEDPVSLHVMSDAMEDVWRRLRLSAGFEPLLFAVWEQSRIDYHPPVRIHGDEVLARRLRVPGNIAYVDLRSDDPFAEYVDQYHRLDGAVQLRRSRFLHLDLDLEYREELVTEGEPLPAGPEAARREAESEAAEDEPPQVAARVHSLQQSRQVRTGEMQYFDTPYLGVLARVTATAGE